MLDREALEDAIVLAEEAVEGLRETLDEATEAETWDGDYTARVSTSIDHLAQAVAEAREAIA